MTPSCHLPALIELRQDTKGTKTEVPKSFNVNEKAVPGHHPPRTPTFPVPGTSPESPRQGGGGAMLSVVGRVAIPPVGQQDAMGLFRW